VILQNGESPSRTIVRVACLSALLLLGFASANRAHAETKEMDAAVSSVTQVKQEDNKKAPVHIKVDPNDRELIFHMPVLNPGDVFKQKPERLEVFQQDHSPLKGREVLLLIHGGGGEYQDMFRWDKVLAYFDAEPQFKKKFKVFLLRYDTTDSLNDEIEQAKKLIPELAKGAGKPITIMALSMGGNVVQGAITDPEVDDCVDRAICMGTPFHGSPLFSADWYQYSLLQHKFGPFTRMMDAVDYRLYFSKHKNYQADLKWDNLDGGIPAIGSFKGLTPIGPKGNLTPEKDSGSVLRKINESGVDKAKIIAYAGYLVTPEVLCMTKKRRLESYILAPYRFLTVRMPAQLGREQPALKVLSTKIGKVKAADESGLSTKKFALNDGITPITSALFLPPQVVRDYPILKEDDLPSLRPHLDIRLGRVFRNIDHVTFVDGAPPHRGTKFMKDELHPEDGAHTIFDWMLDELLERDQGYRDDDELIITRSSG
jgi:pimeloyl-ACP methyl ester carboxylesterase